ncbi:TetR family transcriptional regulator [Nocardia sp. NPDC005978]|uniref:TetR/AcrR family transcriptional regulator n=1 Tax=Nocardia sp. NPDC005978 TaxID=3156725 RepID=UPI0033AC783B
MTATIGRRTQAERSAATVAALVEATIEAIGEVGYHGASLGEISKRAGISKGAIFRHFDSRTDLVVAAANEVRHRHIRSAAEVIRPENRTGPIDLVELMMRVRGQIRHRTNAVWFELLVAARTEADLRERLEPVARALLAEVEELAVAALSPALPADMARLLATSLIHMFDGEAIFRSTYPRPELEESRITHIAGAFDRLSGATEPVSGSGS